ncbi:MAG: pyruvate kinase [Proteobacteria bacterium]|nr:pyruvate kinase [Pseudomonadota bacterium]
MSGQRADRRTKIVCTLGPASTDEATLGALLDAGADAVRINFSHGDAGQHGARVAAVRRLGLQRGRQLAVLQDLQGPKLRLGSLPGGRVVVRVGDELTVVAAARSTRGDELPCDYEPLAREVRPGDRVLLDDGRVVLRVRDSAAKRVRCVVEVGGELSDHKGVNLPGVALSLPTLTAKDRRDIVVGRQLGVDYVALSFVRSADDLRQARRLIGDVPLIAKIETTEALQAIDALLEAADGIMVARGDLGVEVGPERVPMLQKSLIQRANAAGKLVITATEMLESMRQNPRPTRAEASDVANALLDGTDAVMLSGETASGAFPVAAVRAMDAIIRETETSPLYRERVVAPPAVLGQRDTTSAVARACVAAAETLGCSTILCYTESGAVALLTSEYRPRARLVAASEHATICRQLALHWGVVPLRLPHTPRSSDEAFGEVCRAALAAGLIASGELVVFAAGSRPEGPSDLIKILRV